MSREKKPVGRGTSKPESAAYGTYLPGGGILRQAQSDGSERASQTQSPSRMTGNLPTGTIAFEDVAALPTPQQFASVYKTNGAFDPGIHQIVVNNGTEFLDDDDDGDCVQTIDSGDSDYTNTIEYSLDDTESGDDGFKSDFQQTMQLPEGSYQDAESNYQGTIELPEDSYVGDSKPFDGSSKRVADMGSTGQGSHTRNQLRSLSHGLQSPRRE